MKTAPCSGAAMLGGLKERWSAVCAVAFGFHLPAARCAVTLDAAFDPLLPENSFVAAIAVQPDAKILLTGRFASVNGQPRNNMARLYEDGTLDPLASGITDPNGSINSFIVQPDGKIVVVGFFNNMNGQPRNNIARLLADGSVEDGANFYIGSGPNGIVHTVSLQSDGKLVVGGQFTAVDGKPRNNIARFFPDGTLEGLGTFNAGTNGDVRSIAIRRDGKIVLAGDFNNVNGQQRGRVAQLSPDGTLNPAFGGFTGTGQGIQALCVGLEGDGSVVIGGLFPGNQVIHYGLSRVLADGTADGVYLPLSNDSPYNVSIAAVQTDGAVVLGGPFEAAAGRGIARFTTGRLIEGLAILDSPNVYGVALQADGKIVVGGRFTTVNGESRKYIARLNNEPATQSLTIVAGTGNDSRLQWMRGGTSPEVEQVIFERSPDDGASWMFLGIGTRIAGGWNLAVQNLTANPAIRARGRTSGGTGNGSSGIVEQTLNVPPEIAVLTAAGADLADGRSTADYGPVASGTVSTKEFTIRNPGTVELKNLAVTLGPGGNPGDFSVTLPPATTLAPGATSMFSVSFSPTAEGGTDGDGYGHEQ